MSLCAFVWSCVYRNSVHSLRKRSSQEWSQSVFHVEAPPWTPNSADSNTTGTTGTPMTCKTTSDTTTTGTTGEAMTVTTTSDLPVLTIDLYCIHVFDVVFIVSVLPASRNPAEPPAPPPAIPLAELAAQVLPTEGRESPSLFDSRRRRKNLSSSTMQVLRRDSSSSDRVSRLQQEKQMLMEEVKAQKVSTAIYR